MKQYLFLITLFAISFTTTAQSISLEFPAFAGSTYDFVIFQGSKAETIIQDTIPQNGKFTLTIPKQYAPYTGMSRWLLTNSAQGGGIDMAIPGHNFSITCLSDKPDQTNITYKGFDAVNELNEMATEQQNILSKYETMQKALELYNNEHPLYTTFQSEKETQRKAYDAFHDKLKQNPSFNARFLPIVNLTQGIPTSLTDDYEQKALLVNTFITNEVNFNHVYVSGHWDGIINNWAQLQTEMVKNDTQFIAAINTILNRTPTAKVYTNFVKTITTALTRLGKNNVLTAITPTVKKDNKLVNYDGVLRMYQKELTGKAPNLKITTHIDDEKGHHHQEKIIDLAKQEKDYSLLVFYQSGCGPCGKLLQGLKDHYKNLSAKGLEIISISSDTDEIIYKSMEAQFPWTQKYGNMQGLNGVNFKNYAVLGTPTLFLIDKKGTILKKMTTITDVLTWSETLKK